MIESGALREFDRFGLFERDEFGVRTHRQPTSVSLLATACVKEVRARIDQVRSHPGRICVEPLRQLAGPIDKLARSQQGSGVGEGVEAVFLVSAIVRPLGSRKSREGDAPPSLIRGGKRIPTHS